MNDIILARPNETLIKHSTEVGQCIKQHDAKSSEVGYWIGRFHDIGKTTEYFQQFIHSVDSDTEYTESEKLKRHSLIGAYTSVISLKESNITVTEEELLMSFIVINKHHSYIKDFRTTIEKYISDTPTHERLQIQFESILENENNREVFNELLPENQTIDTLEKYFNPKPIRKVFKFLNEIYKSYTKEYNNTYGRINKYYGLLTFADKSSVIGLDSNDLETNSLNPDTIDSYITNTLTPPTEPANSPQKHINYLREQARQESKQTITSRNHSNAELLTLQLPTGFGKTLTVLDTALEIYKHKPNSNIIYTLPLTSIIDQVSNEIQTIFNTNPSTKEFTEHHYRSETTSKLDNPTQEYNTTSDTESIIHAESWASDLTLSTFVQLIESLTSPSNSQSLKLNGLQNAILIIDEIQLLPLQWWGITTKILQTLIQEYNCHIISITATHPYIYNRQHPAFQPLNPTQLLNPDPYYSYLQKHNRVNFKLHPSAQTHYNTNQPPNPLNPTQLATELQQHTGNGESSAAIVNKVTIARETTEALTIKEPNAININEYTYNNIEKIHDKTPTELYNHFKNHYNTNEKPVIANLTANLLPIHRTKILQLTRKILEEDTTLYLISTQVIEAGVDITVDNLYRDLAPPSSIIQSAGRCNRDYSNGTGTLTLIWTTDSEEKRTSESIYDNELFNRVKYIPHLFSNNLKSVHREADIIYTGMEQYFTEIFNTIEQDTQIIGDLQLIKHYTNININQIRETPIINTPQGIQTVIPILPNAKSEFNTDNLSKNTFYIEYIQKYTNQTTTIPLYKLRNNNSNKLQTFAQNSFVNTQTVDKDPSDMIAIYHQPINTIYDKYGINTSLLQNNINQII